jgi:predicted nucleic-acid-binding protein
MRVAVDTHLLVRFLVKDDVPQAVAALRLLQDAEHIFISIPVLCELGWVFGHSYRISRSNIAQAFRRFVDELGAEVDHAAFSAGLVMLDRGGDFADGVIAQQAALARCDQVVTFDRNFARIGGAVPVTLLTT